MSAIQREEHENEFIISNRRSNLNIESKTESLVLAHNKLMFHIRSLNLFQFLSIKRPHLHPLHDSGMSLIQDNRGAHKELNGLRKVKHTQVALCTFFGNKRSQRDMIRPCLCAPAASLLWTGEM